MRLWTVLILTALAVRLSRADTVEDVKVQELERKLTEARQTVTALQKAIDELTDEVAALRTPKATAPRDTTSTFMNTPKESAERKSENQTYRDQILGTDLGGDERENELSGRPELFIQTRYQSLPISGTDVSTAPSNFVLTRMESRWSGRLSEKVGMGFEIQYHPAPAGAP